MGQSSSTIPPQETPTIIPINKNQVAQEQANQFLKQNYLLQSGFGTTFLKEFVCRDAYTLFLEKNEKYFEELERFENFHQLSNLYAKQARVKTAVQYQTSGDKTEIDLTMQKQKLLFAQELATNQKLIYESCLVNYYSKLENETNSKQQQQESQTEPQHATHSAPDFECFSLENYNDLAKEVTRARLIEFLEEPYLQQMKSIQKCFKPFETNHQPLDNLLAKYSIVEKSSKQVFEPYFSLPNCNMFQDALAAPSNTTQQMYILQRNWETCQLLHQHKQEIENEHLLETTTPVELLQRFKSF